MERKFRLNVSAHILVYFNQHRLKANLISITQYVFLRKKN
jgi:hypothetical protein